MATDDDVASADFLIASHRHARHIGVGEPIVEALVDGVGDFPGVTKDRSTFTFSTGFDVAAVASAAMAIASPVCRRSWVRYQPMALRSRLPRADRSASEASRSPGSRYRHTSVRRCIRGRLSVGGPVSRTIRLKISR